MEVFILSKEVLYSPNQVKLHFCKQMFLHTNMNLYAHRTILHIQWKTSIIYNIQIHKEYDITYIQIYFSSLVDVYKEEASFWVGATSSAKEVWYIHSKVVTS